MKEGCYMQYGCGFSAPPGWLNFDASPTLYYERLPLIGRLYTRNRQRFPENVRYGDILRGLPLPPQSCQGVYCSHVLEHLALEDFAMALRRTHELLRPDGTFRLVLPDLEQLVKEYLGDASSEAACRFMHESRLGRKQRGKGIATFFRDWLGNSHHLWMWDEKGMRAQLLAAGFRDVRRADFGDAEDARFREVEDPARFQGSLAMQCRR